MGRVGRRRRGALGVHRRRRVGVSVRRGEICIVDLDPARSAEANKRRPAVVVSNVGANLTAERLGRGVITVVPVTSNTARVFPFQVLLPADVCGLDDDSKAQAEQVRSVAFETAIEIVGRNTLPKRCPQKTTVDSPRSRSGYVVEDLRPGTTRSALPMRYRNTLVEGALSLARVTGEVGHLEHAKSVALTGGLTSFPCSVSRPDLSRPP
ncbi:MAG TPA: type II toxin-antitoxin system PemK/MazF family toxin [Acidimicrobiales bacterium]